MKPKVYYSAILILILIWIFWYNSNQSSAKSSGQGDTLKSSSTELKGFQNWQLDYYPDSMLINKSINDNSKWESHYAYNIQWSNTNDSCQFIGWHESWWNKIIKIDSRNYKIQDMDYQYWEVKFNSDDKLLMRHIYCKYGARQKEDTSVFIPYHRVNKILTLESIDNLVAQKIFEGTYQVIFNDTLDCDKFVTLDKFFGVKGIKGITSYSFETAIDCDFAVFNAFGFNRKGESNSNGLSFKFSKDTLLIKDYKEVAVDGDFDHTEISKTRIKMIKK